MRRKHIAIWAASIAAVLLLSLVAVLSITDWNFARARIGSFVGSKINRTVRIDGDLSAHLLTKHPKISIDKIVIGSPEWVGDRDFAEIERIELAIDLHELLAGDLAFETLLIDKPNVALISDKEGRANFNFAGKDGRAPPDAADRKAPDLPGVKHFTLRGGELYVRDEVHRLTFQGNVEANERAAEPDKEPFRLRGEGTLNEEPFGMLFKGGPLANLRMDEPYEFTADVTAGKTIAAIRGTFKEPFDVAKLTASLDVKGDNLAHLYYLTNLALPFTPPYRASAEVHTSRHVVYVDELDGKVGSSDIRGKLQVALNTARPKLTADLQSKSLDLDDLAPAVGKGVRTDPDTGDALDSVAPASTEPSDKLFPTFRFQFDRLSVMDADVKLHAASVRTKRVPLKEVNLTLKLDDSVLTVDPLLLTLPQGKINAAIRIDAREKVAKNKINLRLSDVHLEQFKGKKAAEPPLDGILEARMEISGPGNSVHELAASANGKLNVIIPHGEVRKAFAELLGINVAKGLGLLMSKDQTKTNIRCGVASVGIRDGNAEVEQMIFDTESVLIKGDGSIDLAPEKLDLDLSGHPKKFQLVRLRTPVTINGTLRKPAIGVDAGDTAKQVGIAAVLGALFTPLTAALAFVDPGLAKDENCSALLADAERAQAASLKPVSSSWTPPVSERQASAPTTKF